jgi:Holliday junction resolvase RusA-like endonuclease
MSVSAPVEIHVRAVGRPAPKGSRNLARDTSGRMYSWPASKHEKPWVEEVARAGREARRHFQIPEAPYEVELLLLIPEPKKHNPWPSQHDLDKLARAVIDGLVQAGVMSDDRHVTRMIAQKRWASDADPGVLATVRSASPPA